MAKKPSASRTSADHEHIAESTAAHPPRSVPQVMVSSTFTDLKDHRAALLTAIQKLDLHPKVMEYNDGKLLGDVVDSSLQMVRDSAAYILIIGLKYGQTPECPRRNPDKLSITELEFNEARRLGRPTLLFIMADDHLVQKAHIEKDRRKEKKLNAFREAAKKPHASSSVDRVYCVFGSLDDFKQKINAPLAELATLVTQAENPTQESSETGERKAAEPAGNSIPAPPAFYAEHDYIGRHQFIGRKAQLKLLSDWAKPADSSSVLLFEAIGGNGKSMLTWHWVKYHAVDARAGHDPWAGRFWYSFYEKGAIMRDFCQHALAYMTGQPIASFEKSTATDLRTQLLSHLHRQPWLLILDGLERVLVAYHRIDAAEVPDEEVNRPTDKILDRNPCDAVRDEDTDLLRALAAATPSKVLISSRLIPRALLSHSGLPLPGVKPLILPGLDEADAEELLRSCGIKGTSADIRYYLTTYCANHPLVICVVR
jgi:hypothetical protein